MARVGTKKQREAAAALHDSHLYCRTFGHNWSRDDDIEIEKPSWGRAIGLSCDTCTMIRVDVIDARGMVSWRRYIQPHGYHIGRKASPKRATLRLEYLNR